jgi:pyruvate carboxylase
MEIPFGNSHRLLGDPINGFFQRLRQQVLEDKREQTDSGCNTGQPIELFDGEQHFGIADK